MRYFIFISYIGTRYHGWQYQENAITIQEILEDKIKLIFKKEIKLIGSSRTDAGVHALKQCAHFDMPFEIDTEKIKFKLNTMLPSDISIIKIVPVEENRSARFSALGRTYHYCIIRNKNPFVNGYWFSKDLDIKILNQAAEIIMKFKDFKTFSKVGTISKYEYLCELKEARWEMVGDTLTFIISANRFLRGMVRSIVWNMIGVGTSRISLEKFEQMIAAKDRSLSLGLAPAHGLTLMEVHYDNI